MIAAQAAGCGDDSATGGAVSGTKGTEPEIELPKGNPPTTLTIEDLRVGDGRKARAGDELVTQFVAVYYTTGEPFESTWDEGRKPFEFVLGAEEASPGWERGLANMRVGGRRELIIPPRLASRDSSFAQGGADNTLVYVIDLLAANRPTERDEPAVEFPSNPPPDRLVKRDLIEGTRAVAKAGDTLTVEYLGVDADGTDFGNSWQREKPFAFTLGTYHPFVSPGWQKGIPGMRVGGRRELIIPPRLLYQNGAPSGENSPEDSIVYVIDLISID